MTLVSTATAQTAIITVSPDDMNGWTLRLGLQMMALVLIVGAAELVVIPCRGEIGERGVSAPILARFRAAGALPLLSLWLLVSLFVGAPERAAAASRLSGPAGHPAATTDFIDIARAGGPDGGGYLYRDSDESDGPDYAFEDIAASGTGLSLPDDALSPALDLGFLFRFYGQDYVRTYVCANGYLTFEDQPCGAVPADLPSSPPPNGLIAAWWSRLSPASGGTLHYATLGVAPYRRFVIQFSDVPYRRVHNKTVTFQVKLFETTGAIEVHYKDVDKATGNAGITYAAGIENQTGTTGLAYDFKLPIKGKAVRYWVPGVVAGCRARIGAGPASGHDGTLYPTVQQAINAAQTGDLIQISGYCGGVHRHGHRAQAVTLNKTLTLRGGYDADFTTWDPAAYPTTLDALGQGRVLFLTGGISATLDALTITGGDALGQQVKAGGGIYAPDQGIALTLRGCRIAGNTATTGGGLFVGPGTVRSVNTFIVDNHATTDGAALYTQGAATTALHTTLARNTGSSSVYLAGASTAAFTNTIVVSHTLGVAADSGSTAHLVATLWGNDVNVDGGVTTAHDVIGEAGFINPDASDYRIATLSAAFDAGVLTGVATDFENHARAISTLLPNPPDLGADENPERTVPRPVTQILTFGAAQATMTFTDTASLQAVTVTLDLVYPTSKSTNPPLRRTYTIHADTTAPFSGTLTLYYTDEEVRESKSKESELVAYREVNGNWIAQPSIVYTETKEIHVPHVTGFSRWALGDLDHSPQNPTAVTLVSVDVTTSLPLPLVATFLLLLAAAAYTVRLTNCVRSAPPPPPTRGYYPAASRATGHSRVQE